VTTYNMKKPAEEPDAAFSYAPALTELTPAEARKLLEHATHLGYVPRRTRRAPRSYSSAQ
jgi:hypothetical protein